MSGSESEGSEQVGSEVNSNPENREWQTIAKTHFGRFSTALSTGVMSDLKIIYEDGSERPVHKNILSFGSPVFEKLVSDGNHHEELRINDFEASEFHPFLKYLYTGEVPVDLEFILPVMIAASKYRVVELETYCKDVLANIMDGGDSGPGMTAFKMLEQTYNRLEFADIREKALNYISKNGYRLVNTPEFRKLSLENLKDILIRDDLRVFDEVQLYQAFKMWGKSHAESTGRDLRELLREDNLHRLIRFHLMRSDDYIVAESLEGIQLLDEVENSELQRYSKLRRATRENFMFKCFKKEQRDYYKPDGTQQLLIKNMLYRGGSGFELFNPRTIDKRHICFKANEAIWLTSLGLCAPEGINGNPQLTVMVKLTDPDMEVTYAQNMRVIRMSERQTFHVSFTHPVRIQKDEWVMGSLSIIEGTYSPDQYEAVEYPIEDGRNMITCECVAKDRVKKQVRFEFKQNEDEDGTNGDERIWFGGGIPELGFMID